MILCGVIQLPLLIYNTYNISCATGTTSGTGTGTTQLHSIVYHIVQYCISYHIVLLILLYSPIYHTAQSCISHSIVLLLLLHTLLQLLLQLLLLYLLHKHMFFNSPYHVYGSCQTYVLFTLHITLLIFLLSHNHATSQLFSHDITQLLCLLSIASVK